MTTVTEAYDLMMAHATAACGVVPVVYADDAPASALNGKTAWARATSKLAAGGKQGLGDTTGLYCRLGVLCIEIFTPEGDGLTLMHTLVEQALISIEDRKSYPVWYRNIRAVEAGRDGGYNKTNIYVDFEYDSKH